MGEEKFCIQVVVLNTRGIRAGELSSYKITVMYQIISFQIEYPFYFTRIIKIGTAKLK